MSNIQLVWNAFKTHTGNSLKLLLTENDFADVTLVCADEKQMKAHKFVLSSGSKFFQTILVNNPHSHPLIYLKDVQSKYLDLVLTFLYFGEVEVPQHEVTRFLTIATELKIKGLTEKRDKSKETEEVDVKSTSLNENVEAHTKISGKIDSSEQVPVIQSIQLHRDNIFYDSNNSDTMDNSDLNEEIVEAEVIGNDYEKVLSTIDNQEKLKADGKTMHALSTNIKAKDIVALGSPENQNAFKIFQTELKDMKMNAKGRFSCTKCTSDSKDKNSLKKHYLSKHMGIVFKCGKCGKELTSQSNLKQHMELSHGQFSGSWVLQK